MRRVFELVREQPKLEIDGEMQADSAEREIRARIFPARCCAARPRVRVPELDPNIAYNMVRQMTDSVASDRSDGRVKPAHVLTLARRPCRVSTPARSLASRRRFAQAAGQA
jgi:phosphotransacetylase